MRLLIHETLVTAPFTHPLTAGWITPEAAYELRETLTAGDLAPDDVALLPAPEVLRLQATHRVVPEAAVIAGPVGAIALRTPVRPDEVAETPVRLWDTDSGAAFLARATLQPFYGIVPIAWETGDTAQAEAVIVEGVEALRPPEAGFSEDLCRAWWIMTAQPFVGHVLVAPDGMDRAQLRPALATLDAARAASHDRRRDLRHTIADAHGLELDRVAALFMEQRLAMVETDRVALLELLQRGRRGTDYPTLQDVRYLPPAEEA